MAAEKRPDRMGLQWRQAGLEGPGEGGRGGWPMSQRLLLGHRDLGETHPQPWRKLAFNPLSS